MKIFYLNSEAIQVKQAGTGPLKIAGYANTVSLDRQKEVITPEAWLKGVENYRLNPVLLFQHEPGKPVGRVTELKVDKKGLFVTAEVSDAAERTLSIQTLIRDKVLKSFSVGFAVKSAKYNKATEVLTINELELLEISIVSVPANQHSLFSIKKSFGSDQQYEAFKQSFVDEEENPFEPIPLTNYLSLSTHHFLSIGGARYKIDELPTAENPNFKLSECDISGAALGKSLIVPSEDLVLLENEVSSDYDNEACIVTASIDPLAFSMLGEYITMSLPELEALKSEITSPRLQKQLNLTINLLKTTDWTVSHFKEASRSFKTIESLKALPNRDLLLKVYGHKTNTHSEENKKMAEQLLEDAPVIIGTSKVSEPRVAELVQKTGEKLIEVEAKNEKAADLGRSDDRKLAEDLAELKGQLLAYRDQIAALTNSKMAYAENSRSTSRFNDRDKTSALLVAKAMGKRDMFDTQLGARMKAVISEAELYSSFSTDIYDELRMKLVVAPMFKQMQIRGRTFRVPVADEDQTDYIAQFPNGVYTTGPADSGNQATSRQGTIGSIDLTPHKFMSRTFIAKDEEEDTVIALIDFLRESAVNRLARGIDKAILRGDGSITGSMSSNSALASSGDYASVIKGIVPLTISASLTANTAGTTTKAGPASMAALRVKLGRYGLTPGQSLAYVTSVEGYNTLVTNADFQTVDKLGPQATYLTGSLGALYGIPVYVSEFMDTAAAAEARLGTLIYKPGFIIGESRSMELETEYKPDLQYTAMYISTRLDFKAMTTVAAAALSTRYSYAATVLSGS